MIQCVKCLVEGHNGCYESPRYDTTPRFTKEKGLREGFLEEVMPDLSLEEWGRLYAAGEQTEHQAKRPLIETIILFG